MSVVEAASPHLRDFLRIRDDDAGAATGARRPEAAGFILGTVMSSDKQPSPLHSRAISAPLASRTLLDIIRDEEPNAGPYKRRVGQGHHGKDRQSWKSFKDRFRLRRAGSAWTSTAPVPSSDCPANKTCRSPRSSRFDSGTPNSVPMEDEARNNRAYGGSSPHSTPTVTPRSSTRFGTLVPILIEPAQPSDSPQRPPRSQMSRHNSARYTSQLTESPLAATRSESSSISRDRDITGVWELDVTTPAEDPPRECTRRLSVALAEERQQSAREAAAAQEAAAAEQPARMSLMDLLGETDREMGIEGTRYSTGEDEEAAEEEECLDGGKSGSGEVEQNCCICMVRLKGAAFIPCGHTFCRLCSRELWVSRGNCPLCNNYIVEILDIF